MKSIILPFFTILILTSVLIRRYLNQNNYYAIICKKNQDTFALNTNRSRFGYFLQITDFHLDDHYREGATIKSGCHTLPKKHMYSKQDDELCGTMGIPGQRMDAPSILIEHTLDWIRREWLDKLDFVIWTGDNSRHNWDEKHSRKKKKVYELNKKAADMLTDVFFSAVPVVPVIGNNDVQPHNLIELYDDDLRFFGEIWKHWIPKDERKSFLEGGYFAVDVVPGIRVLSMNTMFFLKKNPMAKDCIAKKKKKENLGYQHLKWYKQQLEKARHDNVKIYVVGHVPPSPNDFFEGCLHNYVSITSDYSDIVLSHFYGHLNMDHFLIYDKRQENNRNLLSSSMDNQPVTIQRDAKEYALWLKDMYHDLVHFENNHFSHQTTEQLVNQRPFHNSQEPFNHNNPVVVIHVAPSVFPIYMPTIRIYRYEYQQENTAYGKLLGYTQYVANISEYNNENDHKKSKPPLEYNIQYDTNNLYGLPDLSINSYIQFADALTQEDILESKELWNIYSKNIFVQTMNDTLNQ
ncbi:Metallo-dependent phosphatase-like protein [Cokeromyces recurvatus]|uniref:Metallo-dependent phosphatase-like protein n=1 Tax=Cokeromyces recurvatus TaxID=90255 RepID=UPI00221FF8CC|nr:Metallo-dependent phosphatase-like protein [Cokeromyces recurvatus]KAI7906244.1 Metallo-dependent phosphatase-like protein [Cokeromyces recurvatus]